MKTITIRQPFASLIVNGVVDINNRTWKVPKKYIGQRVLIHASKKEPKPYWHQTGLVHKHLKYVSEYCGFDIKDLEESIVKLFPLEYGKIIGSVEIENCVIDHPSIWAEKTIAPYCTKCGCDKWAVIDKAKECAGCYSLSTPNPIYNWVLANPIKFDKPIKCKGKLKFWGYNGKLPEKL